MKRAKNKQLKLEDYLRFFDDHHLGDLTVHHLNQVSSILDLITKIIFFF